MELLLGEIHAYLYRKDSSSSGEVLSSRLSFICKIILPHMLHAEQWIGMPPGDREFRIKIRIKMRL
jgi:hypothetical protein